MAYEGQKVVLITGANNGIGFQMTRTLPDRRLPIFLLPLPHSGRQVDE